MSGDHPAASTGSSGGKKFFRLRSRKYPGRQDWLLVSAWWTGGVARRSNPAHSLACGWETSGLREYKPSTCTCWSGLLHQDGKSNWNTLVDTWAAYSIFPHQAVITLAVDTSEVLLGAVFQREEGPGHPSRRTASPPKLHIALRASFSCRQNLFTRLLASEGFRSLLFDAWCQACCKGLPTRTQILPGLI